MKFSTLCRLLESQSIPYFHVSSSINREMIQTKGLIVGIGPRSEKMEEAQPAIYLFKSVEDAEDAVSNWLGEEFDEDEELDLYQVDIPSNWHYESGENEFEIRSLQDIPAQYITLLKSNF